MSKRLRSSVVSVLSAAAVVVLVLGLATPASAYSTTTLKKSWGRALWQQEKPKTTGTLKFGMQIDDFACDSHEVYLAVDVFAPGGKRLDPKHQGSYVNSMGCKTVVYRDGSYSPAMLKGHRSGYVTLRLCEHAGLHHTCEVSKSVTWKV